MDWSQHRAAGAPRASIAFRARIASRMVAVSAGRAGQTARAVVAWARSLRIPPGRIMLWCAPGSLVGGALLLRSAGIVPKDCTDTLIIAALLGHGVLAWILAADQEGRIRAQREAWRAGGGAVIEGDAEPSADPGDRIAELELQVEDLTGQIFVLARAWAAIAPPAERPRHLALVRTAESQEIS